MHQGLVCPLQGKPRSKHSSQQGKPGPWLCVRSGVLATRAVSEDDLEREDRLSIVWKSFCMLPEVYVLSAVESASPQDT